MLHPRYSSSTPVLKCKLRRKLTIPSALNAFLWAAEDTLENSGDSPSTSTLSIVMKSQSTCELSIPKTQHLRDNLHNSRPVSHLPHSQRQVMKGRMMKMARDASTVTTKWVWNGNIPQVRKKMDRFLVMREWNGSVSQVRKKVNIIAISLSGANEIFQYFL